LKYAALPAAVHFGFPAPVDFAMANGAIDKPAQFAALKFPGRTRLASGRGAFGGNPAAFGSGLQMGGLGRQKEKLPLYMNRYITPSLLKALDGLQRYPQKIADLALGFDQQLSDDGKFSFIQGRPPFFADCEKRWQVIGKLKVIVNRLRRLKQE
jgi:hypothetical protein